MNDIITALTTPFDDRMDIDLDGVRRLVAHSVGGGVDGVFVAGTNGEFPALDDGERLDVISAAIAEAGASRVIAHVGAPSTRQAVRLTTAARDRGAERLAVITPYFLPAGPRRLVEHYAEVCAAAQGAPVYIYVFPALTGTRVPADLMRELASIGGIAGVKVSAPGAAVVREYTDAVPPGLPVWSGSDGALPEVVAAGGAGVVSGVSGALPGPFVRLADALRRDDQSAARAWQRDVRTAVDRIEGDIARIKHLLDLQGLPGGRCRMAIDPPRPDQITALTPLVAA
ncbi:dihydrodipicolinate synthase family protein [Acrocarpospora pleiomorpha]|uniref:Dihydrodipicolinate synthase family protein n=1 Tax=Acrocarpospora pleiomorpha TaxID=90975 RepID=A0A5M3XJC6_9ACTN|nr:dihydrodipicolinate synthase family protein [Acrocarpospora pleiomorpha]GES21567.1 dihydrodipicolinate synthase family protein [Acrocarpospora pleiomorpha]